MLFFYPCLASGSSRTLPRLIIDDLVHSNVGSSFPRAGLNLVYAMVLPLLLSFFGFFFPPDQASSATLTLGVKSPICPVAA
jgi:hypothetical protein